MSTSFDKVYERIVSVSNRIDKLYGTDPLICIKVHSKDTQLEPEGTCTISYQKPSMEIIVEIPQKFKWTKFNRALIDMVICHEYCHYIAAIEQPARLRDDDVVLYLNNSQAKALDEKKTWYRTKALAKQLGLWDRAFFTAVKGCVYTSDINY